MFVPFEIHILLLVVFEDVICFKSYVMIQTMHKFETCFSCKFTKSLRSVKRWTVENIPLGVFRKNSSPAKEAYAGTHERTSPKYKR